VKYIWFYDILYSFLKRYIFCDLKVDWNRGRNMSLAWINNNKTKLFCYLLKNPLLSVYTHNEDGTSTDSAYFMDALVWLSRERQLFFDVLPGLSPGSRSSSVRHRERYTVGSLSFRDSAFPVGFHETELEESHRLGRIGKGKWDQEI